MRSFAIEEPGSPVPALYATLDQTAAKIGVFFDPGTKRIYGNKYLVLGYPLTDGGAGDGAVSSQNVEGSWLPGGQRPWAW